MGMTITEKIFAKSAGKSEVTPGENVWLNVDILMTHDVCGPPTIGIFKREFGEEAKIWDKNKIVIFPDHYIFTKNEQAIRNVDILREFADENVIVEGDHSFYVNLSNPSNATIGDNQGVGTIIDDDSGTTLCSSPTVTLTATGDTWIQENNPSQNNGADSNLHVKPDSSTTFRTLIQFDLSSITPATPISCAAILLFEKDSDSDQTIYIHQVNASWLESQATWNNRTSANAWASAGGDYASSSAASFAPDVSSTLQQVNITALVQDWVDNPGSNFGVLLRSETSGGNTDIQFGSREGSDPVPRLIVEY